MSGPVLSSFDVHTPVVTGITLLEASAGTGKTYQITNLVLRLVVDQSVPLPRIVVVTYTKAATAELKERVRLRLGDALRALERRSAPDGDGLLKRFVDDALSDPTWGRAARRRLARAREDFDQALISTIHGFCRRMLQMHAFETGSAFDQELVRDQSDVLGQLVDDWLVARLHDASEVKAMLLRSACGLKRSALLVLGKLAVSDPDMLTVPAQSSASVDRWMRRLEALSDRLSSPDGPAYRLTELVRRKGHFNGNSYRSAKADAQLAELLGWLRRPDSIPAPMTGWAKWFSPEWLQAKAVSADGREVAAHPLFVELERLVADSSELRSAERLAFVEFVRSGVEAHHRSNGTQSYQDLLRDLDRALCDPERGPALSMAIRQRFDAALIDEFQDTDALQWRIFGRVFGGVGDPTEDHYLYLIGDPKQAIYGFRGANVHVYLRARSMARPGRRYTMRRNFRSDARLVSGLNHLLGHPGVFGAADIDYIEVSAHHSNDRLVQASDVGATDAPVQLCWVDARSSGGEALDLLGNTVLNSLVAELCAADVVGFLQGREEIEGRSPRPDDIAVLVRSHAQAAEVMTALQERNVPAVVSSQGQVFATPEALSVHRWLAALAGEGSESAARVLAADPLLGWTAAELLAGAEDIEGPAAEWWESWLGTLSSWRTIFVRQGFMPAFRSLIDHVPPWAVDATAIGPRLLTLRGGERRMTNLLHLSEILQTWYLDHAGGLVGLQVWLERQRHQGHDDTDAAELRLERDDNAVKVVTVHKSKGLQYGVVFVPFAWKDEGGRVAAPLTAADPQDATARRLVLADSGDAAAWALQNMQTASREEGVRLLYVALTRARHRCVVYWPGMKGKKDKRSDSPLAAVLHGAPLGAVAANGRVAGVALRFSSGEVADPGKQLAELEQIARLSVLDGVPTISVRAAGAVDRSPWKRPATTQDRIRARALPAGRRVDDGWRRHSYSALTRADLAAQAEELVDPTRGLGFDDDGRHRPRGEKIGRHVVGPPTEVPADQLADMANVPMAGFPAGADAGTCLHAILEHLDFSLFHPDANEAEGLADLKRVAAQELSRHGFSDPTLVELVCETFPAVLRTPLGPLLPEHRLCDIAMCDRLDELRFDFPIAGGDSHGRRDTLHARVTPQMLRDALLLRDSDDPVPSGWVQRVGELGFAPLAGIMTGSIDLVFRVRNGEDGVQRWFVVDYKSNRLDPHKTARTPLVHFHHAGMRYEMAHHHYFLQYHLYALALHRFLRLRLGQSYDYDRHMGGVAYLFVRGMTGSDARDPSAPGGRPGVFCDRPPRAVIDALDAIFDASGDAP